MSATAVSGNCCDHGSRDLLEEVPQSTDEKLLMGLEAVARAIAGVLICYSVSTGMGFEALSRNIFIETNSSSADHVNLIGKLHNDDIHSFEDVIQALRNVVGLSHDASVALTTKVDRDGEAIILQGRESIKPIFETLRLRNQLLVSIAPQEVAVMEPRIAQMLGFLLAVGSKSDPMQRMIAKCFLTELSQLLPSSVDKLASVCPLGFGIFPSAIIQNDFRNRFPFAIHHLIKPTLPQLALTSPTFLPAEGVASGEERSHGAEFNRLVCHPFESLECNCLGILVLASPYFAKSLKKLINEIIIKFQHDSMFKYGFSQVLTALYPTINALYFRNIGTNEKSILHTSVQLFTANSIVNLMSSDGTRSRLLMERNPVQIGKMLISTILLMLRDVGCTLFSSNEPFLAHRCVETHRLNHILHDVEYITRNPIYCCRLLSGDVDPGMVALPPHSLPLTLYSLSLFLVGRLAFHIGVLDRH